MLECYGGFDEQRAQIKSVVNAKGFNWMTGMSFENDVPQPIRVELHPRGGAMLPIFKSGILLFSDQVVNALKECGVDNFITYDTEIYHPVEDKTYTNYKAINIIGLVAVADMSKSDAIVHGTALIDVDFDSLAIDTEKAGDFLFFRLAECVTGIVVHESIKQCVENKGITGIDWIEPEDWLG